jgi:hypothetical protein
MKPLQIEATDFAKVITTMISGGESDGARALCQEKIENLLTRYSQTYVLKACVKLFRESIYQAHYGQPWAGKLATDTQRAQYFDFPVNLFTPPENLKMEVRNTTEKNLTDHRSLTIAFPESLIDAMIDKAVALLKSDGTRARDIYAKAVAIELLTGRRQFAEICLNAVFHPSGPQSVYVTGLAKTPIEGVEIPVLGTDPETIIEALETVQTYIKSRPWFTPETAPDDVRRKIDKITREVITTEFQSLIDPFYSEILSTYGKLWTLQFKPFSTHDLRALWVVICHYRLNRTMSDIGVYARKILGHTSERSTKHYQIFKVIPDREFTHWKKTVIPHYFSNLG